MKLTPRVPASVAVPPTVTRSKLPLPADPPISTFKLPPELWV